MTAAPNIGNAAFALRSTAMTLVSVVLKTTDLVELATQLAACFDDTPELFDHDAVVIDLTPLRDLEDQNIDVRALVALLKQHRMMPVAAKGGNAQQMAAAHAEGLAAAPEGGASADPAHPTTPATPEPAASPPPVAATTLIIDRPLRSGQQVYARGGDLVVLGVVSHGAEVIADGSIHVYGPLRGRAIAGAKGDGSARIFATAMEAQLISIAGTYRTTETELPPQVLGKPAQVRLAEDQLIVEPLKA